jgi:3-phenylpropionate/trans-cinnamate dioxygenase ferredoxin component
VSAPALVWHKVCAFDDLEVDQPEADEIDGLAMAFVRTAADEVHAIHDMCSHASVALSEGEVVDGEIECWLHGSTFSLSTGKPTCLPAVDPVPVYPVRIEDGIVYVAVQPSTNRVEQ